eukprot:scaffold36058_cov15-Tisochrysis_lutea.AAC.1
MKDQACSPVDALLKQKEGTFRAVEMGLSYAFPHNLQSTLPFVLRIGDSRIQECILCTRRPFFFSLLAYSNK